MRRQNTVKPMLVRLARATFLALALAATPGWAATLDEFNAAVEQSQSHNRVAIGYLRTGNTDLASVELDRLRESWGVLQQRFGGGRPDVFKGNAHYDKLWTVVAANLIAADLMLKTGRPEVARQSLDAINSELYALRRSASVMVLADCVRDANAVMDALMTFDGNSLANDDANRTVSSKASEYGALLDRCESLAGDNVRANPEFRRLIDGARNGLSFIPKAVAARDGDLLHRVLGELRAFDNLLAFRFG
jgi:hypothetical protein